MKTYAAMGTQSDVSVTDEGHLGDAGIEINTRDGRTWSALDLDGAIEQLDVLADQGVRGCRLALASLEVERLVARGRRKVREPVGMDRWAAV